MVLGRLSHYAFDAILITSLAAGIKRATGLSADTNQISDPTTRGLVEKYLGFGEFTFDSAVAAAGASKYFTRTWSGTQAAQAGAKA